MTSLNLSFSPYFADNNKIFPHEIVKVKQSSEFKEFRQGLVSGTEESEVKLLSRVRLFATPWTVVLQAPSAMEFSRHEYWSRLPFPSPGDLPDPGIEPGSPTLRADTLLSEPPVISEATNGSGRGQ